MCTKVENHWYRPFSLLYTQWRAEGTSNDGPGYPRQGGIQRVKLQK